MPGKTQQGGMEADGITAPFQNRTFKVVVEQNTRNPAPGRKGPNVAAQKVLHPRVRIETQEYLARITQHHDEGHQRPPRAPDLEVAKMAPIHLRLFAGQRPQAQIGLDFCSGSVAGDDVAEMVRTAAITALADHRIKPARGQAGKRLQGLVNERQIGIDPRRAGR
jgi:hypothetical protein